MNFKITKVKVIGSIVIPLILWALIATTTFSISSENLFTSFLEIHNMANIFAIGNIFIFLVEVIVVYLVWSLFQSRYMV